MAPVELREPARGSLLYDPRVRAAVYQIGLALALAALIYFAASNAAENLRQSRITSGFDFLGRNAGFDINQSLISFSATGSTYGRAFLVGLLNTLVVSIIGVFFATILGFLIGIARLSTNWIVAKVSKAYVELIRNVPLLLQLFFWYNAVLKPLPEPRNSLAIAGITTGVPSLFFVLLALALLAAAFGMIQAGRTYAQSAGWTALSRIAAGITVLVTLVVLVRWSGLLRATDGGVIFLNNRGLYLPEPVWGSGIEYLVGVFALGIAGALAFRAVARKVQLRTGQQYPVGLVAFGLVVILPAVVWYVMWLAGMSPISFNFAVQQRFNLSGGVQVFPEFVALLVGLVMYTAAFIAEIVRAGVLAVSKGQTEAAHSLGLRGGPTLRLVIIPQAMRVIVPPLTNQYLNLTKNSSLAVAIGYPDLVQIFAGTVLNQTGQALEVISITMAVYLSISLLTSLVMNAYNRRVAIVER